jgi:hypothetical protein
MNRSIKNPANIISIDSYSRCLYSGGIDSIEGFEKQIMVKAVPTNQG